VSRATGQQDGEPSGGLRGGWRHVASALAGTAAGVLPATLFGGLSPLIRAEFGFAPIWIGLSIGIFFLTSSLTSPFAGRLSESVGSQRGLWIGTGVSVTALLGIGLISKDLLAVCLFLAFAGFGNATIQTAANIALARGVDQSRRGLAFGLKQAAVPVATAIGGFSVPTVGLNFGWRVAFIGAAILALTSMLLPTPTAPSVRDATGRPPRLSPVPTSIWLLTIGIALGAGAANGMTSYFVESSIEGGWSVAQAGTLLGLGSLLGILSRIVSGAAADRMVGSGFPLVSRMMLVGAFGFASFALLEFPLFMALGLVFSFIAGWGYNGLFIYSVVRLYPEAPGAATGVTQIGAFGGPVVGPIIFGALITTASYEVAWIVVGVMSALGALAVRLGHRAGERERAAEA
jgi:MFS family permease